MPKKTEPMKPTTFRNVGGDHYIGGVCIPTGGIVKIDENPPMIEIVDGAGHKAEVVREGIRRNEAGEIAITAGEMERLLTVFPIEFEPVTNEIAASLTEDTEPSPF